MRIVAVTACPTGIAHSAMAAEALELAAREAGHEIEVEIQGAAGGPGLDPATIAAAEGVIFAVDAGVRERDRFAALPAVEVRTRHAIDRAPEVVDQLVEAVGHAPARPRPRPHMASASPRLPRRDARSTSAVPVTDPASGGGGGSTAPMAAAAAPSASGAEQLRLWLMTGVSYMLPFVVAGGILIALGFAVGGATRVTDVAGDGPPYDVGNWPSFSEAFTDKLQLGALFFMIGSTAFSMLVPILAGYIAFGMVDRPGIAPGVVAGLIANQLDAGFLGGLAGGLLAGAVVMGLQQIQVRGAVSKMMPILVYPVVGTLITGAILVLVIGEPIADAQSGLTNWLEDLQGTNAVVLGLLLGAMMAFDMGGPVNKAAYAFGLASLESGNYTVMAAVMVAGMTPPLGLALATTLRPKLFTVAEHESGRAAWLLGASFITEGAIPFAAADPLRVIPSLMAGSATAAAISLGLDAELRAPHGGVFVLGLIGGLPRFVLALVAGTAVTAAMVAALKGVYRSPAAKAKAGVKAGAEAASMSEGGLVGA